MPRIPVGNRYTATVSGSTLKYVTCSCCGCQFVYQLKREASGEATSFLWLDNSGATNRARKSASKSLNNRLQNEVNARSCPDCGMYQENMVGKLKRNAWNEVFSNTILGAIFLIVAFFVSLFLSLPNSLMFTLLIAISVFRVWSVSKATVHAFNLNPNAHADKRKGRTYSDKYPVLRLSELEALRAKRRDF
jgi:hypothetical protein